MLSGRRDNAKIMNAGQLYIWGVHAERFEWGILFSA